jgi:SPP1 gp7 family putative phage head morphogenesis protein
LSGKIDTAYWMGRFTQLEQSNHREAEKVMQDVESAYREAARDLEGQISTWYRRFADNNGIVSMAEARRLLNSRELAEFKWKMGDYARHAKENGVTADWTKQLENASARWHISRLEAIKMEMQNTVEVLFGNQLDSLDALAKQTYLSTYNHTAFEIQKGTGIGFDIAGLNPAAIKAAVYKPWTLDGRNFSDRIWSNKTALIGELHKQLTQNLMVGGNLDHIVETIQQKMGVSKYNAGRLVYTENAYIQAVAAGESYRETGVKKFQFIATLDDRTSDICRSMDGNIYDMKDYQPGITVPPLHPWCRSCTAPYFAELAGVGERFARNPDSGERYFVPREMTYQQWEKTFVTNPGTGQTGSKAGLTPVGNSGIVSLKDCKTVQDIEKWLKDKNWFRPDSSGTGKFDVQLSGCDLEAAREIARAYEQVITEFPCLKGNIDAVQAKSLSSGTYAQCYSLGGGRVEVSTRIFKDAANLKKMYERDVAGGFHCVGTDWTSIVTHELGHALDGYLTNQGLGGSRRVANVMRPKVMKDCGLKVADAGTEVSRYAMTNAAEWFAECFAEGMKSASPRKVAMEFMKQLRELVKGVKIP